MKLTDIHHVFFDLDHTLWDFDKNSGLAFNSIFKKNKIQVELENFLEIYTPINSSYWKLYRENKVSQQELRYGRLRESFDALKLAIDDLQIEQLALDYIDHLPVHNHLLEGTLELLDYLRPLYKLHIITNGFKEVQFKKLRASGILEYFDSITTSEDVGVKKPDKRIFLKALTEASARPEESVMVGDNFEADILGARSLGMHTIIFDYYKTGFKTEKYKVLEMKEISTFL